MIPSPRSADSAIQKPQLSLSLDLLRRRSLENSDKKIPPKTMYGFYIILFGISVKYS